jgi:perosamine synthetase
MITTDNTELFRSCSSMRNRGLDLRVNHEQYSRLGGNRRMSEVQGILGCYQLKRLEEFVGHRNSIAAVYHSELRYLAKKGRISFQEYPSSIRHAYWRFVIFLKNAQISRDALKIKLLNEGIRIDWPYQPLLHLQPVFKNASNRQGASFLTSEQLASSHLCLPIHMGIKAADAKRIAAALRRFIR